jgi:predicted NBD/HSP70 family sugar kinase
MTRVLAADIGATNARFALVDNPAGAARIVFERIYPTASFPDFEPALAAFRAETRGEKISRAVIAIAGPIDQQARTAARCCAASPGRARFARTLIRRSALPVSAERATAVRTSCPPPSPYDPSISISP